MLYIMRHGKTDWNTVHKLQGRTDIPLNDEGRKMVEKVREENKGLKFDVCYCSPLMRAKETAELFLKGSTTPIICDERLIEMGFGKYEGIENSFEIPDCPINTLFHNPVDYKPEQGAESLEELYARTGDFIRTVIEPEQGAGKKILIIGHGAMNAAIICQIKKIPLEQFWDACTDNCKLQRLL